MSRREEVDHLLSDNSAESGVLLRDSRKLARTLADEVDTRDDVITKLLALLEPGSAEKIGMFDAKLYTRACEIAGRTE